MSECTCKCHEPKSIFHCLKCHMERCSVCQSDDEAPSSDPVGEAMVMPRLSEGQHVDVLSVDADGTAVVRRIEPNLPDLTEMWASVFKEGVK